ncbi:MAG: endonuclease V [Candidatus Altiarchaeota archaeon]
MIKSIHDKNTKNRILELIKEQEKLSKNLFLKDSFSKIEKIAGVDQGYIGDRILSCIVVMDYKNFRLIEISSAEMKISFPYISGLLAYREMPVILKAYKKLKIKPDVLLVDGHGIAHPRNFGLASHLSLCIRKPTIGVAKNKLIGNYKKPEKVLKEEKLVYNGKIVGYALKTKENCKEIFISPGNFISLKTALRIVKNSIRNEKLPEPLRLAHKFVNEKLKWQNLQ